MKILFNNISNIKNINQAPKINFGAKMSMPNDSFEASKTGEDEAFLKENFSNLDLPFEIEEMIKLDFGAFTYISALEKMYFELKLTNINYEALEKAILNTLSDSTAQKLKKMLQKSGITDLKSGVKLAELFKKLEKSGKANYAEVFNFVELFGMLENKDDILNFYEILNEAHVPEIFKDEDDKEGLDLDLIIGFLKSLGFKNENEFCKKFSHLKDKFNGFCDPSDKFDLYKYVVLTYPEKVAALSGPQALFFFFDVDDYSKFYVKNASIIDYLYEDDKKNFKGRLNRILMHLLSKEQIHPTAQKVLADSGFIDTKTTKGKVELFEFLRSERLTIEELNALTKTAHYFDTDLLDLVINREEIQQSISCNFDVSNDKAKAFYMTFPETLNALYGDEETLYYIYPEINLLLCANEFGLKSDKDFLNFYNSVNFAKNSKGKKQANPRVRQKDISEFVNLLSFMDENLAQKYKKDKNYPLKNELLKKKAEFEKISAKIESEIDAQNTRYLCRNSYEMFINYYDVLKTTPDIKAFVAKVSSMIQKENLEKEEHDPNYPKLLDCFKDKELLQKFAIKNDIRFDGKSQNYNAACLRILAALLENKDEKEACEIREQILKSDFIKNSKRNLIQFAQSFDDEELKIILKIINNEKLTSVDEFFELLKPYFDEDNKIDNFLAKFVQSELSFGEFLEKISQIEKAVAAYGINAKINNKNISNLDFAKLKGNKINPAKIPSILEALLNFEGEGSFICGLNNTLTSAQNEYNFNRIIKEISMSEFGRYGESYQGIMREFKLDRELIENSDSNSQLLPAAKTALKAQIRPLEEFINSDSWMIEVMGKKPNICLHAKMRLIDRFILQENKDLFANETKEELQNILKTIYFETPSRVETGYNAIVLYYPYEDYEIKAVFAYDGEMLTVVKNV